MVGSLARLCLLYNVDELCEVEYFARDGVLIVAGVADHLGEEKRRLASHPHLHPICGVRVREEADALGLQAHDAVTLNTAAHLQNTKQALSVLEGRLEAHTWKRKKERGSTRSERTVEAHRRGPKYGVAWKTKPHR